MGATCLRSVEDLGGDEPARASSGPEGTARGSQQSTPLGSAAAAGLPEPKRTPDRGKAEGGGSKRGEGYDIVKDRGPRETGLADWALAAVTEKVTRPARPPIKWSEQATVPVPVTLHIYNVGTSAAGRALNAVLKPLGTGIFHCGVEVHGYEWSYSCTTTGAGDGIFPSKPKCCEGHSYCESLLMGETSASAVEVDALIEALKEEWPVHRYHTLKRNCCHFSNELCQKLNVGSIPSWVMNLAGAGAAIVATADNVGLQKVCCSTCAPEADPGVEMVEVVSQLPVLRPGRGAAMAAKRSSQKRKQDPSAVVEEWDLSF